MQIKCFNIRYSEREKILSVCGPLQLHAMVESGHMSCYDSLSAPSELTLDISANWDELELLDHYDDLRRILSDETGLTVTNFSFSRIG